MALIQSNTIRPLYSNDKPTLKDPPLPPRWVPKKPKLPRSPSNPNSTPSFKFFHSRGLMIPRCPFSDVPPKPLCKRPAR